LKQIKITPAKDAFRAKRPFHALLRSVGNPDFNQHAPVSEPLTVFADTLEALLHAAEEYREFWSLGAGNWPRIFVTESGKRIGTISYNGKLVADEFDYFASSTGGGR
jgi:hypothetical protein